MMQRRKLFVGNLADSVTDKDLAREFSYFGRVKDVRLIENKRIGFVEMSDPRDAARAEVGVNGVLLKGRRIRVEMAH